MRRAYLGLGSNLDNPAQQVRDALEVIGARFPMVARSPLYRSRAIGLPDQPDYCNAACIIKCKLEPQALMDVLLQIEVAAGRVRDGTKWGPRVLDLDILHIEGVMLSTPDLRIPHPEIRNRNFVLWPLAYMEPDLFIPGVGNVGDMAIRAGAGGFSTWKDDDSLRSS